MSFETQCLICDSQVEEDRHGNLITAETGLRARVEKILCRSLDQSPRCYSLCVVCEQSIDTIEEYYRHVEHFQKTYATTAAKYGESVSTKAGSVLEEDVGGEVGGMPSWTICFQASDGSLVPIQQSASGMVMADDNQIVLETVTVESSETNQDQIVDGTSPSDMTAENIGGEEAEGGETNSSLLDHTGMAITEQVTESVEGPADMGDLEEPIRPQPCFACAHCNLRFDEADNLMVHERTTGHSGNYNYKCGICGNIYARLDSLRDHMCRHTGQKPHKCEVCGEGFSFRNQLSRHRTTHYQQETQQTNLLSATNEDGLNQDSISIEVQDGSNPSNVVSISKELAEDIQNILGTSDTVGLVQTSSGEMKLVQTSSALIHECPKCREAFPSHVGLQRHQCPLYKQEVQLEDENTYPCPKCRSIFTRRVGLERHRCPALYIEGFKANNESRTAETPEERSTLKLENAVSVEPAGEQQAEGASEETNDIVIQVTAEEMAADGSPETNPQTQIEDDLVAQDSDLEASDADWRCSTCMSMFASPQELGQHLIACVSQSLGEDTLSLSREQVTEEHKPQVPSMQPNTEKILGVKNSPAVQESPAEANTDSSFHLDSAGVDNLLYGVSNDESKAESQVEGGEVDELQNECDKKDSEPDAPSLVETPTVSKVEDVSIRRSSRAAGKVNPILEMLKKKKRPVKSEAAEVEHLIFPDKVPASETPKRKAGRPSRVKTPLVESGAEDKKTPDIPANSAEGELQKKRKRGRPRKIDVDSEVASAGDKEPEEEIVTEKLPENPPAQKKRKRGRPRKTVKVEEAEIDNEGEVEKDVEGEVSSEATEKTVAPPPPSLPENEVEKVDDVDEDLVKDEESSKENKELTKKRPRNQPKKYRDHVLEENDINSDDDLDKSYSPSEHKNKLKTERDDLTDGEENEEEKSMKTRSHKGSEEFTCKRCVRSFSCAAALRKHETSAIHLRGKNTPDNRKFTCNICGRGFMKLDHLRDHSVNHTGELPHSCLVCDKKFKFRSQLALHRTSAHSQQEIDESMKANPLARLRRRYKNSHLPPDDEREDPKFKPEVLDPLDDGGEVMYRCKICNTLFTELRLFNRHVVSHFKVKPFKCDICSKEFARADTLRCHKKVHYGFEVPTESGLYLCDTCGRQFKRVDALRSHVKMHYGQRPWKCKDCGKAFVDRHTLGRHVVIHQTQKPFLCATCGRGFNRKTHLEVHEAQHAGIHLHKCDICDRTFNEQGNLQRHMIVHSDARPWPCPICGERFKRKGNLDEHQLTHNKERQAVCDICGARFNTKRYLRIHQLIHSGDRPHKCPICSATFRQLSALITHKRIHTGHAPYKCTRCDKRFKYYDQWKAHEYSHTDAKPYKCLLCSATYRQAGSLRQHRKMAHGNQKLGMLFLCSVCNKTFSSTVSLERHMKRVHDAQASLQSIQTIGEQVTIAGQNTLSDNQVVPAASAIETSNIVHITNPQGGLETIELTNLTDENGATANIVQLLNGQTLTTLNADQVTMTPQGGVQFTDGQRFVQFVSNLGDGNQVIDISGATGQVISIDGLTTAGVSDQSVTTTEDGVLQYDPNAQHTVVQLTDAQAFVEAVSQMEPPESDGQVQEVLTQEIQNSPTEDDGQTMEIHSIDTEEEKSLPCIVKVSMPQGMETMSGIQSQMVSSTSLVPIEVVPVETTVTTMEAEVHDELNVMETVETSEQIHVISDGSHHGDLVNDPGEHGLSEQEVVETVSIATTSYEQVPNV